MPKVRRSRLLPVDRLAIWRVVSDPHHMWRWWPKVARVEAVQERRRGTGTAWTNVLKTEAGKTVRADFRCLYSTEPSEICMGAGHRGTPFAKVLRSSVTALDLSEAEGGTLVTLEADQGPARNVSAWGLHAASRNRHSARRGARRTRAGGCRSGGPAGPVTEGKPMRGGGGGATPIGESSCRHTR